MSSALTKTKYSKIINKFFNKSANPKDSLTSLNTAFSKEGVYIHIPKNTVLDKPVEIIHFATKVVNFSEHGFRNVRKTF